MSLRPFPPQAAWMLILGPPLLLYLYDIPPTVSYGGDCGELSAGVRVLGNVHPTGYPLYLLSTRLLGFLPWGEFCWRTNLASFLAAAAALAATAWLCRRQGMGWGGVTAAVWGTAFGYVFWSQAIITEVYLLHMALVVGAVACLLEWERTQDGRWWWTATALAGLGMANHVSVALFLPLWLLWSLLRPRRPRLTALAIGALLVAAGLLLYLYLPLRAWRRPPINSGNPDTWERFRAHITAQRYRGYVLPLALRERMQRAGKVLRVGGAQLGLLWPLALVGWALGLRRRGSFWALSTVMMAANVLFFAGYQVPDVWIYFLPSYWLAALWAGWGWEEMMNLLARWEPWGATLGPAALWSWVLLSGGIQVDSLHPYTDLHGETFPREFSRQILAVLPPDALLLTKDDEILFSLLYVQFGLGERPDVRTRAFHQWLRPVVVKTMREVVQRELGGERPLYTSFWAPFLEREAHRRALGPVCEVRRTPPPVEWKPAQEPLSPYLFWCGHEWSASVVKRGALLTLWVEWAVPAPLQEPWEVRAVFRRRGWPPGWTWQQMASLREEREFTYRFPTQYIDQVYGWIQTWRLAQGQPLFPPEPGARFREGYPVQVPPSTLGGSYDVFVIAYPAASPLPPPQQWVYAGSFGVFALKPGELDRWGR